jgi:NADH:ubiquinone oxidoreductase subunit 3 (subunit A)
MSDFLFLPPIAFTIVMLVVIGQSSLMKRLSPKGRLGAGAMKAYSCGEDMEDNKFRPEYGQFFSFAFFFSIMHVVALVLATMPSKSRGGYFISALYVLGALIGLQALLRRDDEARR